MGVKSVRSVSFGVVCCGDVSLDFIGKFENLEEDYRFVASKLGCDKQLANLNKVSRKNYKQYYTGHSRKIVASIYSRDCELFEYTF